MKKITTLFVSILFTSVLIAQLPSSSFFEYEFTGGSLANTSTSGAPNFTGSITSIADRNTIANTAAEITGTLSGANVGSANVNETTLCFWMKHSALSSNERILQIYGNGGVGYRLQMTGSVLLYNGNVANTSYGLAASHQETVNIDDNAWHHIAVRTTLINPNTLEFDVFLDNVLLPNISNTFITLTGPITRFIENGNLVVSPTNDYTGDIDDIYFYKTALTDAQIGQIYNYNPCTVNIPDANFKAYLVGNAAINTNGDAEIQCSEASAFSGTINCTNQNISNLTGIEAFTSLTKLYCITNSLTSIDLSQNTALTELNCSNNSLTALNVSQNINLTEIDCSYNNISSVSVSNNTSLEVLDISHNQISNINTSTNTLLEVLRADNNNIASIDISSNSSLIAMEVNNNQLSTIDVSSNSSLINLYAQNNAITSLDISLNTALNYLDISNNSLTSLNVANGNNSNFYDASNGGGSGNPAMDARQNAGLSCIQIDAGFTPPNSPASSRWEKDAAANYSASCVPPCTVNIPDANFKAYLVGNALINTNGDTEIQCSEASAFNGTINCNNSAITDLTGIETFTSLTKLYCYNNQLTSLDVSSNTALTYLTCQNNQLTSLNLSTNTVLNYLNYSNNTIPNLSLSNNIVLEYLFCNNNQIASLDLSANTALLKLSCTTNQITSLDLSSNTVLDDLNCSLNQLTSLDVSANTALTKLYCGDNQITSLDLSTHTILENLFCNNNQLTSLNIANTNNANMINMFADNNPNLTCIEVDNVAYSNTNWTNIDATANFSTNCSAILVSSIIVQGSAGASTITTQGGTLQMFATVFPGAADDATYTWSVNNGTGSASIDANGLLTALTDGTVEVIATANDASGVTGSKTITISNQTITAVLVNAINVQGQGNVSSITTQGGTLQMLATVLPINADDATYTWSVNNSNASISSTGILTALADGTVEVTATANDTSGITGTKIITISNQSVGINDITFENISVYPNPTSGIVNLNISETLTSIRIMDLTGKTIQVFNAEERHLDISSFNSGIYFLEIANAERKSVVKIIKK